MSLGQKHIRDIVIYTLPKAMGYFLSIATLPILTRLLSPEDFGVVAFTSLFPMVAVSVVTLGVLQSHERYYFTYRNNPQRLNAYYFSVQLFAVIIAVVSSFFVYVLQKDVAIIMSGSSEYAFAFFVGYVASFLSQLVGFYQVLYQYMGRATMYGLISVAQALLTSVFSVVLVWKFHLSYMGLIYGSLAVSSLMWVVVAGVFNWHNRLYWDRKTLSASIRYGLQIVPKSLSGFINRFFDKYLLNNMVSLSVVGIYTIGQNVSNAVAMLMSSVGSSFTHLYYRDVFDRGEAASESTGRLFSVFSFLSLVPVLLLVLFAQEIVFLLAPPSYSQAVDVIVILSAAMGSFVFGKYVGVQYAYANKAYLLFPVTVSATIANVVANSILIPRYGLMGAAFSAYCSSWVGNGVIAAVGQRLYRITYDWPIVVLLQLHIVISMASILTLRTFAVGWFVVYAVKFFLVVLFVLIGVRARIISRVNLQKLFVAFRLSPSDPAPTP